MMAEQTTKKRKVIDYSKIIEWGKAEIEKTRVRKTQIINEMADKLAKVDGIELQKISTIISNELRDQGITPKWVRTILPPEYKMAARSRNISTGICGINSAKYTQLPETEQLTEEEQEESIETQYGAFQIQPESYLSEDLEKYDRNLLIRIIRWHEDKENQQLKDAFGWDSERRDLKDRIKQLEQEIRRLTP